MQQARILIFAKYPDPGRVKTRMVPPLTHTEAAELHTAALLATCELAGRVDSAAVEVFVSPDHRTPDLASLLPDHIGHVSPQRDGDLGRRLTHATQRAFIQDGRPIVLLGADSPTLLPDQIKTALHKLSTSDAVLGPCTDGGYYLLALSRFLPDLFSKITWGTDSVAAQTRRNAKDAGIKLAELDPWYDLDRFDDLPRAAQDLSARSLGQEPNAEALMRLVQELLERNPTWKS
ncbi:MAG: TIGR04282 family arsenosugar biosynthesis glycosyltransferase [Phycisphaerae bacterium]